MNESDIHNYLESKDYSENTRRQYEWRINKIITDESWSKQQKWFFSLFKDLKHYMSKKKTSQTKDVDSRAIQRKVISLQKELEIYKQNMSVEQIDATTKLLIEINKMSIEINEEKENSVVEKKREVNIENENKSDLSQLTNCQLKLTEENEKLKDQIKKLEEKLEKEKQRTMKYFKKASELEEQLTSLKSKKPTYSSDDDEDCGYY